MKQRLLILVLFLIVFVSKAQESKKYLKFKDDPEYSEGYIIGKNGNEIPGLIHIRKGNFTIVHIEFNGSKKTYSPSLIRGYFAFGSSYVSDDNSFYKIIQEGKRVNLYKKEIIVIGDQKISPGFSEGEVFYVKKSGDLKFTAVTKLNFKNKFSEYFSDCEKLKTRIEDKGLGYDNLEEIIYLYNTQCEK